ncbi:MAG: CBS domain-containing protein [Candidatus Omnitrophota bacterium]
MKDVPLKDIMVTHVITGHIDDRLSVIEEKFSEHSIRHIPIVDDKNRILGIFTYKDLAKILAPHRTEDGDYYYDKDEMDQFVLRYVMTKKPVTLGPDDMLKHAVDIMAIEKYDCIPIAKADGTLVGIVSQVDIMKFLSNYLSEN